MVPILRNVAERLESARVARLPRYRGGTTKLPGCSFEFTDAASFLATYDSVFGARCYHFKTKKKDPRILDCGANTGLVSFYLKKVFPGARITAFEPDKVTCAVLRRNVEKLGVEVVEAAVWTGKGATSFLPDGADGGKVIEAGSGIQVATVALADYLQEDIDLLKLDVEGAEIPVLQSCDGKLARVRNLVVEYHDRENVEQKLDELLSLLRENAFKYQVFSKTGPVKPLANDFGPGKAPLMLDIFCTRSASGER